MSKKKRERNGREYNGKKREREYCDKYRITLGRRESTNTMASIDLQREGYIIMRTIRLYRNSSRFLNFISLCKQFGNVAMYQNYIHGIIAKYVVLIRRMSLKKIFYYISKAISAYLAFLIFRLCC